MLFVGASAVFGDGADIREDAVVQVDEQFLGPIHTAISFCNPSNLVVAESIARR
jgi:hypothetical protein